MAEQKNKKTTAKTTAKKTETKSAKSSEKKTETKPAEKAVKKETTKVNAKPARFGDSLLDEIILLLIIVVAIIVFVSLLTDKMGIIGALISAFVKGLFGFSGLLLPIFVVLYCVWMLVSEEKKYPVVRGIGAFLFLLTLAAAAQLINPVNTGNVSALKKCGVLYSAGAFSNGGLFGGLIGGGLYSALDTLGSAIVLLAVGIISIVMATGKSFFHAIADAHAHGKERKRVRNEKIKNKAERIRQQEQFEAERLAIKEERKKKTMAKEDFNIEVHEKAEEEIPYVKETVFQKKPASLETKKREPIFDFVKEKEREANLKAAAEKYVAETSHNAVKAEAAVMADAALRAVQMQEELPVEMEEDMPAAQMPEAAEGASIIDIVGVDEATMLPRKAVEPVE
ncbi:MAG: DNA translocase FtsK 4TM domain-containing protein, partial [Anaerotignum sp.]|nr:DNA translocase FtsK 4TM domain-containing protein [Anaerotignum sp.]